MILYLSETDRSHQDASPQFKIYFQFIPIIIIRIYLLLSGDDPSIQLQCLIIA